MADAKRAFKDGIRGAKIPGGCDYFHQHPEDVEQLRRKLLQ